MESVLILVAAALRLGGGAGYTLAVVRGRARPNPVTRFCWALAPLVAFAAQAQDGLDPQAWMTFIFGVVTCPAPGRHGSRSMCRSGSDGSTWSATRTASRSTAGGTTSCGSASGRRPGWHGR